MIALRHLHQQSKCNHVLTVKDVIETYNHDGFKKLEKQEMHPLLLALEFPAEVKKFVLKFLNNKCSMSHADKYVPKINVKTLEELKTVLKQGYFLFKGVRLKDIKKTVVKPQQDSKKAIRREHFRPIQMIRDKRQQKITKKYDSYIQKVKEVKNKKRNSKQKLKMYNKTQNLNVSSNADDSDCDARNIFSDIANIPSSLFNSNCPYCDRKFLNKLVFVSHKLQCQRKFLNKKKSANKTIFKAKQKKLIRTFRCSKCTSTFMSEKSLALHLKFDHRPRPTCKRCSKIFDCKRKLDDHQETCAGITLDGKLCKKQNIGGIDFISSKDIFFCNNCENPFETLDALRLHKHILKRRIPIDIEFTEEEIVKEDLLLKKKEQNIEICIKNLPSILNVKSSEFTGNRCKYCLKQFQNNIRLKVHMHVCKKISEGVCIHCNKIFENVAELNNHYRKCQIRKYKINSAIELHSLKCPFCDELFADDIDYDCHLYSIHNMQHCESCNLPYCCENDKKQAKEVCEESNYNTESLVCLHCYLKPTVSKAAVNVQLVNQKMNKIKTMVSNKFKSRQLFNPDAKSAVCLRCHLNFSSALKLKEHIVSCNIWQCDYCEKTFPKKLYLHKHKKRFHELNYCEFCWTFYPYNQQHLCESAIILKSSKSENKLDNSNLRNESFIFDTSMDLSLEKNIFDEIMLQESCAMMEESYTIKEEEQQDFEDFTSNNDFTENEKRLLNVNTMEIHQVNVLTKPKNNMNIENGLINESIESKYNILYSQIKCQKCLAKVRKSCKLKKHMLRCRIWQNRKKQLVKKLPLCKHKHFIQKRKFCLVCQKFSLQHKSHSNNQLSSVKRNSPINKTAHLSANNHTTRKMRLGRNLLDKAKLQSVVRCNICNMLFPSSILLECHKARIHKVSKSNKCGIMAEKNVRHMCVKEKAKTNPTAKKTNSSLVKTNVKCSKVNNALTCSYCNKKFSNKFTLKKHLKNFHVEKGNDYSKQTTEIKHHVSFEIVSKENNSNTNPKNQYNNVHETVLERNLSTDNEATSSKCIIKSNNNNNKDMEHIKPKIFCEICMRTFTCSRNLRRHNKNIHNTDSKQNGKINCSISNEVTPNNNKRKFSNDTKETQEHVYAINEWKKNKEALQCNSESITDGSYKQSIPSESTTSLNNYENGENRKNITSEIFCELCMKIFYSPSNLKRHKRNVHKIKSDVAVNRGVEIKSNISDKAIPKDIKDKNGTSKIPDNILGRLRDTNNINRRENSRDVLKSNSANKTCNSSGLDQELDNTVVITNCQKSESSKEIFCELCMKTLCSPRSFRSHKNSMHHIIKADAAVKSKQNGKINCSISNEVTPNNNKRKCSNGTKETQEHVYAINEWKKNKEALKCNSESITDGSYKQSIPSESTTSLNNYENGENRKKITSEIFCELCTKIFYSPTNLKRHKRNVHKIKSDVAVNSVGKKAECDVCFRKFRKETHLENHRKVVHHLTTLLPLCNICNKYFNSISTLNRHKRNSHHESRSNKSLVDSLEIINQRQNENDIGEPSKKKKKIDSSTKKYFSSSESRKKNQLLSKTKKKAMLSTRLVKGNKNSMALNKKMKLCKGKSKTFKKSSMKKNVHISYSVVKSIKLKDEKDIISLSTSTDNSKEEELKNKSNITLASTTTPQLLSKKKKLSDHFKKMGKGTSLQANKKRMALTSSSNERVEATSKKNKIVNQSRSKRMKPTAKNKSITVEEKEKQEELSISTRKVVTPKLLTTKSKITRSSKKNIGVKSPTESTMNERSQQRIKISKINKTNPNHMNLITSNKIIPSNNELTLLEKATLDTTVQKLPCNKELTNSSLCHICSQSFSKKLTLAFHLIEHTNKKLFSCYKCKSELKTKSGFIKHFSSFHTQRNEKTKKQGTSCKLNYGSFIKKHKFKNCQRCLQLFISKEYYESHSCKKENSVNMTKSVDEVSSKLLEISNCCKCGLKVHVENDSDINSHFCENCVFKLNDPLSSPNFMKKEENVLHLKHDSFLPIIIDNTIIEYKCQHCSQTFQRKSKLQYHYKSCLSNILKKGSSKKNEPKQFVIPKVCEARKEIEGQDCFVFDFENDDENYVDLVVDREPCLSPKCIRVNVIKSTADAICEEESTKSVYNEPVFCNVSGRYEDLDNELNSLKRKRNKKRFWFGSDESSNKKQKLDNDEEIIMVIKRPKNITEGQYYFNDTQKLSYHSLHPQFQLNGCHSNKNYSNNLPNANKNNIHLSPLKINIVEPLQKMKSFSLQFENNLSNKGILSITKQQQFSLPINETFSNISPSEMLPIPLNDALPIALAGETTNMFERNAFDFMKDYN